LQALGSQFTPGVVQIALHRRELADQRCQRRLRRVEQHDADGSDHKEHALADAGGRGEH
jgi:hypothetical protein